MLCPIYSAFTHHRPSNGSIHESRLDKCVQHSNSLVIPFGLRRRRLFCQYQHSTELIHRSSWTIAAKFLWLGTGKAKTLKKQLSLNTLRENTQISESVLSLVTRWSQRSKSIIERSASQFHTNNQISEAGIAAGRHYATQHSHQKSIH